MVHLKFTLSNMQKNAIKLILLKELLVSSSKNFCSSCFVQDQNFYVTLYKLGGYLCPNFIFEQRPKPPCCRCFVPPKSYWGHYLGVDFEIRTRVFDPPQVRKAGKPQSKVWIHSTLSKVFENECISK